MKLEQSFEVKAPLERVWRELIAIERVAPCLPGAEITEAGDDGVYRGNFSVRLGPTTAAYRGELHMEEADEATHVARMRASGQDKRGQGGAKATIVSKLSERGDATLVEVETDFTITGRLARFGRGGMIQDVSNRLLREFAECLQKTIEAAPAPAPEAAAGAGPGETAPDTPAPTAADAPSGAAPVQPAPGVAGPPSTRPVKGFSLLASVLWERVKRLFRRRR
jgi:carbon monoxide dehydrogenase subunit G